MIATPVKTDDTIKQQVAQELRWDNRVDETRIGVGVDHGVVTLSGVVDSYAAKLAAVEAAHSVAGVLDVANEIEVRWPDGASHTDTDVAKAVRNALVWDVWVPDQRITSTVVKGWVTLSGTVDTWRQRNDADRAIRRLGGVRGITNNITVTPTVTPTVSATHVKDAIETTLERRKQRELDRIHVDVADGVVTLSGPVPTWGEKTSIIGAVEHAPGVRFVEDQLRVTWS
jgi:osmotically-inducible protein OsmY